MAAPVLPYKGNVYDIPFGQSGMIAHENRWLAQRTELLVAQNVTFENDVLQKDPAVQFYDPVGIDPQNITANGTVSTSWQGCIAEYGGARFATVNVVGSLRTTSTSQSSPWAVTIGTGIAVGTTLVLSFSGTGTSNPAVTDTRGNTYVLVAGGTATGSPGDPAITTYLFTTTVTTTILNGDTLTITWSGGSSTVFLVTSSFTSPVGPFTPQQIATVNGTGTGMTLPPATDPFRYFRTFPGNYVASLFVPSDSATDTVTFVNPGTAYSAFQFTVNLATVGQLFQAWMVTAVSTAIVAQIDWNSEANSGAITGTVAISQGSTTVTGTGTSFTTTFARNDVIIVNGEEQSVSFVASNTSLTTYNTWVQSVGGATATRRAGPRIVSAVLDTQSGHGGSAVWKEGTAPTPLVAGAGILAGTLLQVGNMTTRRGRFVIAGKESSGQSRKLFFFTGQSQVRYLADDGIALLTLSTPPVDWSTTELDTQKSPVNGLLHQGALFGWGNLSDPHRIYRSTSADHTKFVNSTATDDAGQYPIASSIGERLWCGAEYQGVLFLWKYPRGIFYFDDTDPNFLNWSYHIVSEALGCAPSPHAALPIDSDCLFVAPDGHIHLLSAVASLGGTRTSDLTRMLGLHRWTRENVHIPSLNQMCSAYNPYTKTAYFGMRSTTAAAAGAPDNDLLLKLDFSHVSMLAGEQYQLANISAPVRFSYSTSYKPNALCIRRSTSTGNPKDGTPLLLIGEQASSMLQVIDDGSIVTKLAHGFRNDAARGALTVSTSYAINATTPRLDFSDADPMNRQRRKNWDWVEFVFGESAIADLSGQTLTAQFFVDGNLRQTMTIGNITNSRVAKPLRCGNGYELQIVLTTTAIASAPAANPVLVPDIVGLGIQVYWRPSAMDHSRPS